MALSQAFYKDWFQELRGLEAHNKAKQRTKARCVQIAIPLRSILWQFEYRAPRTGRLKPALLNRSRCASLIESVGLGLARCDSIFYS